MFKGLVGGISKVQGRRLKGPASMADLGTSTVGIRDEDLEEGKPTAPGVEKKQGEKVGALLQAVKAPLTAEELKPHEQLPPFAVSDKLTQKITALPNLIFDDNEDPGPVSKVRAFANSKATNPADGFVKGIVSLGHGLAKGLSGVVLEPIKGGQKDGGIGFLKGVGKGLTGLVLKPISGVLQLGSKTVEGIVTTPVTIADKVKENDTKHFGIPLRESLQKALNRGQPHLVLFTLQYLIQYGMDVEGLFRENGSVTAIAKLKSQVDAGEPIDTSEHTDTNAHNIAGLLKLYLKELPDPLIPFQFYNGILQIGQEFDDINHLEEESLAGLKAFVQSLPVENQYVLFQLCLFLRELSTHSDKNKMTAQNLATVLSPAVIRPQHQPGSGLQAQAKLLNDLRSANDAFRVVMLNCSAVFDLDVTEPTSK